MKQKNRIMELVKQNGGYLTSSQASKNGLSRGCLLNLVRSGELEKSSRGVYALPNRFDDVFLNTQTRHKKGIFSLGTSLYLLGLTDITPNRLQMTFPSGYNLTNAKRNGISCTSIKKGIHELGIDYIKTPNGNTVKAYCAERTLAEILVKRNKVDMQFITDAFKEYTSSREMNLPALHFYAKLFGVESKVSSYLEVLL